MRHIQCQIKVVMFLYMLIFGGAQHFKVGRIWIDPEFQNQDIGQSAMQEMFERHADVRKWTLGTPTWASGNQHFYEKAGFVKLRETEVDPALGWSGIEYELICDHSTTA